MGTFIMLFISLIALAKEPLRKQFDSKIYISPKGYFIDKSSKITKYKCNAYSDPKEEGIKVRFINKKGIEYALECKGSEVGTTNNLIVTSGGKTLTKILSVATSGGDCDLEYSSHFWLEDINSDGFLDYARRDLSSKTDHGCEGTGTGKIYEKTDKISIFIWNKASAQFEKKILNGSSKKSYSKRFQLR